MCATIAQTTSSPVLVIATLIVAMATLGMTIASLWVPWFRARKHDPTISLRDVTAMKWRRVDPVMIAEARGMLANAGIDVSLAQLETQHLAGGKPLSLARALVKARSARLDLTWSLAMIMQLAGRDVESIVASTISPRDIEIPDAKSSQPRIEVPTRDGSKVRCRFKVRVRTVLDNVIGGVAEPEVVRVVVDQAILAIADAPRARDVVDNPAKFVESVAKCAALDRAACEVLGVWLTSVAEA